MKKILLLITVTILYTSCDNKSYKYVETVREKSVFGGSSIKVKDEIIISASSDSAAYIEAYKKFCIAQKVYNDMQEKGMAEYLDIPVGFKLLNSEGEDISDIYFITKAEKEEEISKSFLEMENVVGGSSNNPVNSEVQTSEVDSAKMKELLPFFKVKKDEFDPKGKTWYEPKSAPKYVNVNGIYIYFSVQDGKPLPLRFRVQYYAEDWLFFKKIQFSIDDNAFEYIPSDTETDSGNGGKIWEWCDEPLTGRDTELIYALSVAKSAKMKLIGRQYHDIKIITKSQITDIKRTLELYRAMGGVY